MKKPLVSVLMLTYAHEDYIREAIESVLMQECNFDVELIVADDCSPDNTGAVVKSIMSTTSKPDWIKYHVHKVNKGPSENSKWIIKQAKGKYIAICEGDDYWTDPLKLQKQVDFLEKNENFSACSHRTKTIYEYSPNNGNQYYLNSLSSDTLYLKDLLLPFPIHTSSLLFKRKLLDIERMADYSGIFRDNPFMIILSSHGPFKVLPEVMSVYRRNKGGISENISIVRVYKAEIKSANDLKEYLRNFYLKSLYMKSHWHFYYLVNQKDLSLWIRIKLFSLFLIPSFYNFPNNLKKVGSALYNGFIKH